ncbi:NADH-quinone oxidoreductase subunit C [Granulicella arctica]|uniref:NADH-quinone oxidoreductase subunit C n=1 Tax=Granulicella arctica TaxID=940613 RepID=A0A7Y9TJB3_9BACT|nr:NADH-quinone oxidoreductase subunit C [Granulicella arctica]NYF78102.1 NADH-quinone oxidoreductase subunit C [Granulicella arctica]
MNLELLESEIEANVPGCRLEIIPNPSPSAQHSLLINPEHALTIAEFLRDAAHLRFDYCSNVTGIDWPAPESSGKIKLKEMGDGMEQDVEEEIKIQDAGYLEVVYHLYSMEKKHGPVTLRMRTEDRAERVHLPSLTPVWRSADFQEREIFDLYGVVFDGHPDLRRILMWDEFEDHPMRKDYREPDDYEYEPTAHDEVLRKAKQHHSTIV